MGGDGSLEAVCLLCRQLRHIDFCTERLAQGREDVDFAQRQCMRVQRGAAQHDRDGQGRQTGLERQALPLGK